MPRHTSRLGVKHGALEVLQAAWPDSDDWAPTCIVSTVCTACPAECLVEATDALECGCEQVPRNSAGYYGTVTHQRGDH